MSQRLGQGTSPALADEHPFGYNIIPKNHLWFDKIQF